MYSNTSNLPTSGNGSITIKARGYYATTRPDGKVVVKGRGPRRIMTMAEFAETAFPQKKVRV